LALSLAPAQAAERSKPTKYGQYNPDDETVDMFDAMKSGQLEVKLIPKDSAGGRVFIANKTPQPLNVKLPDAFAALPILAQVGGGGRTTGGINSTGQQAMGGGMGGMGMGGGMGGGGMGGGGGMFNVPAGGGNILNVPASRVGEIKVTTVCLEHGKAEPRSNTTYELKPIEGFTDKPGVRELCTLLGTRQIDQRAAQAAAWVLTGGQTWQQLMAKRIERADGDSYPYFSPQELQVAMTVAQTALTAAEQVPVKAPATPSSTIPSTSAGTSQAPAAN